MDRVLLIEDDESLGRSLKELLEREQFGVQWCSNLSSVRALDILNYQIIILDWMLPDGQGIDFLKELRQKSILIPVIMLTARADLIDKILGLESGANDYLTKPFEPRELIARIRVQLRNVGDTPRATNEQNKLSAHGLEFNLDTREVFYLDKKLELTKMEFDLLKLLVETPGKVFSRDELLNKVWGYENYPTTRTVDTHILQLRQKTDEKLIETVRGIGYRFVK